MDREPAGALWRSRRKQVPERPSSPWIDSHLDLGHRPHYRDLADPAGLRTRVTARVWYDWPDLLRAWEHLVGAAERTPGLAEGPLGRDLADVAMALLLRVFDHRCLNLVERAGAGGRLPDEGTEPGDGHLDDYASRLWAGLVGDYYRSRWELWGQGLERAAADLADPADPADPPEASARLHRALLEREEAFLEHGLNHGVPRLPYPDGDVATRSRALLTRYGRSEHP